MTKTAERLESFLDAIELGFGDQKCFRFRQWNKSFYKKSRGAPAIPCVEYSIFRGD